MMTLNIENPMRTVVKHSSTVFQSTFPDFRDLNNPQKQRASNANMNMAAPLL